MSIPCLIAAALLAVWLVARMRALGHGRLARAHGARACASSNPVTLYALQYGHAEELLGAVLCVAAVLAAQRGRAGWAGLLLGLAIANKEWALLAVGPVLLALPAAPRGARSLSPARSRACFYVPLLLPRLSAGHGAGAGSAPSRKPAAGAIFQPWQLWWFFGAHGHLVRDTFGVAQGRLPDAAGVAREHPPPADHRAQPCPPRCSPRDAAAATRCCCSPSCSRCAARSTPGTPSTTRSRSSSPCSPGRRCSRRRPPVLSLVASVVGLARVHRRRPETPVGAPDARWRALFALARACRRVRARSRRRLRAACTPDASPQAHSRSAFKRLAAAPISTM